MSRKNGLLSGILLLLCVLACILYIQLRPAVTAGTKNITVLVNHLNGVQNHFNYETEDEYLGEVLQKEGLISGEKGPFGLYITTVDDEIANADKQQWWNITKDGEAVTYGVDEVPIMDGDAFELTLMEGW